VVLTQRPELQLNPEDKFQLFNDMFLQNAGKNEGLYKLGVK